MGYPIHPTFFLADLLSPGLCCLNPGMKKIFWLARLTLCSLLELDNCIGLTICLNLIKNIPLCMPIQFSWLILKPIYLHYIFWYFNIAMEAMGR